MPKINAGITALGSYVPDYVLTNAELETMVDTNDEWIRTRTGIVERRILKEKGKGTSFLGVKAAGDLIDKNNIDPATIDLVLFATATPDMVLASTGAYVATKIGAVNAFAYDLQSACSGFLYGMSVAASYIESGRYKKVLLIGADKMSSIIDYTDRTTCIIFGDGGGAALFEPNYEGLGFQNEIMRTDGTGRKFLKVELGGSQYPVSKENIGQRSQYLVQDGRTVFKNAISSMSAICQELMDRNALRAEDVDWLIAHQANQRIIDTTAGQLQIKPSSVLKNIEKYGNTTSATIPLVMADFEHQFKKGDNLIFTAFGAGFSWGAIYLKWAYDPQ